MVVVGMLVGSSHARAVGLCALASIAASGCFSSDDSTDPPQQPQNLLNRTFVSTSVTEHGEARPLVPGTEIVLTVSETEDGRSLGWRAGCNHFGADVTISATILEVVPAYSTAMGCSRDLIDQDEWLAEFFEGDPEWGLSGEELILTSGENRIAFIAESPASAKRLQSVRRSPPGLHGKPASDREVTLAERIMSANAFLGRIADAGGGYRIGDVGLVNGPGPDRILGLVFDLDLERPVDGIYELPVVCYGVSGPPFALPATPFRLTRVSRLIVMVTFADRRVASIDPSNGHARREPGAAYLSLPSACTQRAVRDIGY